jgi:hypothetical protein
VKVVEFSDRFSGGVGMTWLLDKHFEFAASYSLAECERFLATIPKRKRLFWSFKTIFLAESAAKNDERKYTLGRYLSRGVYSEVTFQLLKDRSGLIIVTGFGRVHMFTFLFSLYFVVVSSVLAWLFRPALLLSLFLVAVGVAVARRLYLCFVNRNQLIEFVYENLA